jgi:hypothetical protein
MIVDDKYTKLKNHKVKIVIKYFSVSSKFLNTSKSICVKRNESVLQRRLSRR